MVSKLRWWRERGEGMNDRREGIMGTRRRGTKDQKRRKFS
jgi:hypothetical protein